MSPGQVRAARGLLGWSQGKLSELSGVSSTTIKRMEKGGGPIVASHQNVVKIQKAFDDAGVLFTPENGGGAGVRFKDKKGE
jgi:transcriptional regulator with XRE-family HTH domain